MRLRDLELEEYVDTFGKMTQKYFVKYIEDKGSHVDWLERMRWSKYNAMFKQLVKDGQIEGKEADTKYWIRLFRDDVDNIGKFIQLIKQHENDA